MNRNLHSPTKLTEFARDFDNEPETFLTKFVNKLTNAYNSSYNTVNVVSQQQHQKEPLPSSSANISVDTPMIFSRTCSANSLNQLQQTIAAEKSPEQISNNISSSSDSTSADCSAAGDKTEDTLSELPEERTPYNVIQRISNLMALRSTNLSSYKNTELQRFWMPDSKSKECYECSAKFSTFRRKHHCRLCGQIFCSKCCNQVVPGKIINCSGDLKVCTYCSKIVLSYLKSADINADLKSDLKALQDDLANKLSLTDACSQQCETSGVQLCRKISVGYQEERLVTMPKTSLQTADRKAILQQSNSLKTIHMEMSKLLPNQNRGDQLVAFLIANLKSSNRVQAIAILNAMLEAEFILPLLPNIDYIGYDTNDNDNYDYDNDDDMLIIEFNENSFYKLLRLDDVMTQSGSFQLDLNVDTTSVHLKRPMTNRNDGILDGQHIILPSSASAMHQQDSGQFGFSTTKEFEMENSLLSTAASKALLEAFCDHEDLLLTQLLRHESLDQSWAKILLPICARIANSIRPELCGMDHMDIRNLVNFKKVPGGLRTETKIVGGVIFSKNVVHKDMATFIENPKVLLLQCAIVYQRVEGKFVSIESLLLAEREYLRNVTARILSLKPNVVLVHKNVSGIAQDMLRDHGITLVLDVKLSVLDRLARCLKCDIVTSIDSNIGRPKLGTCGRFYIQAFDDKCSSAAKTLMFFETPSTPRGCCVLLRGGTNAELIKVKRVGLMLLFARYNWRLELSFLLDEFARPPSPKSSIFDSKDHSPSKGDEPENDDLSLPTNDINVKQKETNKLPIKCERKNENEKTVNKENVKDFSDPLRATDLSLSAFDPETSVEFAVETPYDNRFRTALSSTVLSISPFVSFPLPYLETEQGRKCHLRSYYPIELYYSEQWSENSEKPSSIPIDNNQVADCLSDELVRLNPVHPFVMHKITTSIDSNKDLQALWASFKASGGRLQKVDKMKKISSKSTGRADKQQQAAIGLHHHHKFEDDLLNKDAFDFENHQRLPVLFCSYYYNQNAPSSFCAQPSLLNMKFYGQNDIMLGQFLEHYCFQNSYMCPSCHLPMLDHVRRYVHSMGCIQVKLNEDYTTQNVDQILMTSWCSICHEMTPSIEMSKDTWCLSFAKYLELRFHSHAYKRRVVDIPTPSINVINSSENRSDIPSSDDQDDKQQTSPSPQCSHSLHRDHVQYFSYNGIVASFTYTAIEVWEIGLPCMMLDLRLQRAIDTNVVLEEIKNFALRGFEVYAKFQDKLAELSADVEFPSLATLKQLIATDQSAFRDKVSIVQTLLTEKNVKPFDIIDSMLLVKKILADSIEMLGPQFTAASIQNRTMYSARNETNSNEIIDSGIICTEDLLKSESIQSSMDSVVQIDGLNNKILISQTSSNSINSDLPDTPIDDIQPPILSKSVSDSGQSGISNRDVTNVAVDKKSVKTILRELLASDKNVFVLPSPIPPNAHYCLPLGNFPVVVYDHDLSSVIAYTLVSDDYRKALTNLQTGYSSDAAAHSPKVKRRSQDGLIDGNSNSGSADDRESSSSSSDRKSGNNNKSSLHVEINFQDSTTQFTCKIYFAREFDAMRSNFIRAPSASVMKQQTSSSGSIDSDKNNKTLKSTSIPLDRKSSSNSLTPKSIGGGGDTNAQQDFDDVQLAFARSLCESIPWEARGGKSGSKFCKTYDDRFVLKEMSRQDVTIFENFAPNYFIYVNQCLQNNQPTLLTKIFGVFKVSIKKKDSMLEKSVLIMENLFFNCDISNKFDLKGSDRNRFLDPTNQNGEIVLLDENLIKMSWSKPLYVLSHSKSILREAIIRDATFLENNYVMDYSLLVGLNTNDRTLVLGIIDYIRTFTFDKRLESLVKQTGILGGQGKLPTVVSPKLYKQRFSEAMERYFLTVPDRWEGLAKIS